MPLRINPHLRRLVCSATGDTVEPHGFTRPVGLSPGAGKPVVVEYDLDAVRAELSERRGPRVGEARRGLWRHEGLLPVQGVPEGYADDVGDTPLVRHPALGREHDVALHLKLEGLNPSGSFKDRGLAVGIALGAACGARRFCLPTQGNAGVAAALFSSRLGLEPALVYMPEGYPGSLYHRACTLFGGEVRFAGENIAAAGRRMRADLADPLAAGEAVDLSTFFEPGRLEGKKTLGLEIAEHFGAGPGPAVDAADGSDASDATVGAGLPDWILYPTGGGTGLVGIWKAFAELAALGALDPARRPLPRMVAVQSERCAPVVQAFERGRDAVEPVVSAGTVADGLDVPAAIMGHRMLAVLRESGGTAVAVSERAIRDAFAHLGRAGVSAGYESAALLAALRVLRERGDVAAGSRVLLVCTSGPFAALGEALRDAPG